MRPVIALLTDFGLQDPYVGIMKGIIKTICPEADLIDLTHEIPAQDIGAAAFALLSAISYFPKGTVFLVVVDPGVGTARRPIALQTADYTFVAPDNGVLSYALTQFPAQKIIALENQAYQRPQPSHTFHGRDIFAPAAAYLANGEPLAAFGTQKESLTLLPIPEVARTAKTLRGEIISIDHFGNAITNVRAGWVPDQPKVLEVRGGIVAWETPLRIDAEHLIVSSGERRLAGVQTTYAGAALRQPLLLVGSAGFLEIAVNGGDSALQLGLSAGDSVIMAYKEVE